jgi:hypothetical protein
MHNQELGNSCRRMQIKSGEIISPVRRQNILHARDRSTRPELMIAQAGLDLLFGQCWNCENVFSSIQHRTDYPASLYKVQRVQIVLVKRNCKLKINYFEKLIHYI